DHRRDPVDGERGLGDVGRQDHLPPAGRAEDLVLARRRQVAVERQDGQVARGGERRQGRRRALDLAHPGQEDEEVAYRFPGGVEQAPHAGGGEGGEVPPAAVAGRFQLAVTGLQIDDLDRVLPAPALDRRGAAEEGGEGAGV